MAGTLQPWPADRQAKLDMAEIIFITGPTRSGKSRRAVEIAQAWGDDVVFVATYRADSNDAEMVERVRLHRAERTGKMAHARSALRISRKRLAICGRRHQAR